MNQLVDMRAPCPECGDTKGMVKDSNGQRVVRCAWCSTWCYNQPLAEAGLKPRKVKTRETLSLGQRQRILERDNHACVSCHATDTPLHIGHLLSVHEGKELGMSDAEINHDLNLAAMCEACNLGLGKSSVAPRLVWASIRAAMHRKGGSNDEVA